MKMIQKPRAPKSPLNTLERRKEFERRAKRAYAVAACLTLSMLILAAPAFATGTTGGDPLEIVNNLSDFIFSLIRAIGMILLGFGILQLGLSSRATTPPSGPTAC